MEEACATIVIHQLDREFDAFPIDGDRENEDWGTAL
jgi:hypothetical protein